MNDGLKILHKFYKELGVEPSVTDSSGVLSGVDKRLVLQKAVFVGQLYGVDLGYSYNWYVRGPYSPSLANDYYDLQNFDDVGDITFADSVVEKISKVKHLFEKYNGKQRRDWLEALASIAFLVNKSNKTVEEALEIIAEVKGHISAAMRDEAVEALRNDGILA